eukprot:SAG11_NODE_3958_length_2132_cov_2.261190_1_plen_348_part_00
MLDVVTLVSSLWWYGFVVSALAVLACGVARVQPGLAEAARGFRPRTRRGGMLGRGRHRWRGVRLEWRSSPASTVAEARVCAPWRPRGTRRLLMAALCLLLVATADGCGAGGAPVAAPSPKAGVVAAAGAVAAAAAAITRGGSGVRRSRRAGRSPSRFDPAIEAARPQLGTAPVVDEEEDAVREDVATQPGRLPLGVLRPHGQPCDMPVFCAPLTAKGLPCLRCEKIRARCRVHAVQSGAVAGAVVRAVGGAINRDDWLRVLGSADIGHHVFEYCGVLCLGRLRIANKVVKRTISECGAARRLMSVSCGGLRHEHYVFGLALDREKAAEKAAKELTGGETPQACMSVS